MNAEEILAKAADVVEFSGRWVNHNPDGSSVCAATAVYEVAGLPGSRSFMSYSTALGAACREATEIDGTSVLRLGAWNDAPRRTKEEVATMLRNAKRWLR